MRVRIGSNPNPNPNPNLRAKACGFEVAFYDPGREDGADKALGIRRVGSLEALLAQSECVSLHCLCDASTAGLLGARVRVMVMVMVRVRGLGLATI